MLHIKTKYYTTLKKQTGHNLVAITQQFTTQFQQNAVQFIFIHTETNQQLYKFSLMSIVAVQIANTKLCPANKLKHKQTKNTSKISMAAHGHVKTC